jgi:hypothetical protein
MIRTFTRPMTDGERAEAVHHRDALLAALNSRAARRIAVFSLILPTFLGFLAGCGIGLFLSDRLGLPRWVALAAMAACTVGGLLIGYVSDYSLREAGWRSAEQEAVRLGSLLERGEVEVTRVAGVQDAAELAFAEDEGPFFLLDIGDGQVMCLFGPYLFEAATPPSEGEEPAFPCHTFDLVRYPGDVEVRRIECYPPSFAPSRALEWEDVEAGYIPEDGEVLTASLATLEDDLRRIARERGAAT